MLEAMSFENDQKRYYLSEINRSLPINPRDSMLQDNATIMAALGSPVPAGTNTSLDAHRLFSDLGSRSDALKRDAECRAIPYPGTAMRDPAARTGCGWWFSPDPSVPSIGAYGTRRGPMSPNLDTQIGPGEWVWDPAKAYQLEGIKQASSVRACKDLTFSQNSNVGWCPATNRAILTDGNGRPAFPQIMGGDCPVPIIMSAANCPPPSLGGGGGGGGGVVDTSVSGLCTPNNSGALQPTCLQAIAATFGCPNGSLAKTLGSGYAGTSSDFNATNAYLTQRGFTLHSGIINDGKISTQDALKNVQALKAIANAGDGSRSTQAAQNLCYGTPFDPCSFSPTDRAPYDATCITQTALAMGYKPAGKLLPANIGMAYWNKFSTWSDVVLHLRASKDIADLALGKPADQAKGIEHVYGLTVKYPKQGCNTFGVLMYRYFFPNYNASLFPVEGPQTHFLGRYILKKGFPMQGSAMVDMTPAGGYIQEGQRMVANFYAKLSGTYQFLISCDDFVRLQIDDKTLVEVGCCNVPTPSPPIRMIGGQVYKMVIDLWNGGGPWSFSIAMSYMPDDAALGRTAWIPLPLEQLYMTQDRRLPAFELAFNKMPSTPPGPIQDTNNIFHNLFLSPNASIGSVAGKNCLVVSGPNSGVYNYYKIAQGVRARAFKSITMMVYVNTPTNPGAPGASIFGLYNLPDTSILAEPRRGAPPQRISTAWGNRTQCFNMWAGPGSIVVDYKDKSDPRVFPSWGPQVYTPCPTGQWTHYAFIWDDDYGGYATYSNGKLAGHKTGVIAPAPQQMFEQMRIGCDNTEDGANWTGGIAWFRAFDYRLSDDLIKMDMNDAWTSVS